MPRVKKFYGHPVFWTSDDMLAISLQAKGHHIYRFELVDETKGVRHWLFEYTPEIVNDADLFSKHQLEVNAHALYYLACGATEEQLKAYKGATGRAVF